LTVGKAPAFNQQTHEEKMSAQATKQITIGKTDVVLVTVEGLENFPFPVTYDDAFASALGKMNQDFQKSQREKLEKEQADEAAKRLAAAQQAAGVVPAAPPVAPPPANTNAAAAPATAPAPSAPPAA
jgi:hypothetical protein